MHSTKYNQGFTLVEMVVYIAIATIVLGAGVSLYSSIVKLRTQNQAAAEVEEQGQQMMTVMTQTIRNAKSVTSVINNVVTLQTYTAATSPTIFSQSGNFLNIKEGAGAVVPLNSSQVIISNLSFINVGRTGTHSTVRISFTLTYVSNGTAKHPEDNYSATFYDTAEVRGTMP